MVVQRAQLCRGEILARAMVGLQPGISIAGDIYIMTDLFLCFDLVCFWVGIFGGVFLFFFVLGFVIIFFF